MNTKQSAKSKETLWRALEQGRAAPRAVDLPGLSGLGPDELLRFERAWSGLQTSDRRQMLQTLMQLAEDDFEMDFNAIFRLALHDEDPEVRTAGTEGLWEDDDPRLIPELLRLLLDDKVPAVGGASENPSAALCTVVPGLVVGASKPPGVLGGTAPCAGIAGLCQCGGVASINPGSVRPPRGSHAD